MLYPFFLDGIVGDRAQHLDDGLHPNRQGVETIAAAHPADGRDFLGRPPAGGVALDAAPVHRARDPAREIAEALPLYQGGLPGARWIEPADYHVTLRFLGDVEATTAEDVVEALAEMRARPALTVTLDGPRPVRRRQAAGALRRGRPPIRR